MYRRIKPRAQTGQDQTGPYQVTTPQNVYIGWIEPNQSTNWEREDNKIGTHQDLSNGYYTRWFVLLCYWCIDLTWTFYCNWNWTEDAADYCHSSNSEHSVCDQGTKENNLMGSTSADRPTDRKLWFMMIFCITLHLFNMPNWRWFLAQQEFTAHTIASLSLSNDRLMTSINWFDKKLDTQQNIILNLANIFFMIKIVSQLYGTSFFSVTLAIWWKLLGWVTSDAFLNFRSTIPHIIRSIMFYLCLYSVLLFF